MIVVYYTGPRQIQPIKGLKLPGGTTISQYCKDTKAATAWIAKQMNPSLYHIGKGN
jgi:hypothetical protein